MKLYIVRHAEPDYEHDSLTPKGWREAELLAPRLAAVPAAHYYVSPLGRAQATASRTLELVHAEAETLPWLREFNVGYTMDPAFAPDGICWDLLPRVWAEDPLCYDPARWGQAAPYRGSNAETPYHAVCEGLDALLARHGYVRDGHVYRAEQPNRDAVILFCHFGLECVLLSHLLDLSPVPLWHHTVALPSSVTILATEERTPGTAVFRMLRFGDLSHLDGAGEEPSFHARFRETADSTTERA